MPTHLIEAKPGFFIEVNDRFMDRAGVRARNFRRRLTPEARRAVFGDMVDQRKRPKYSTILINEAVALSLEIGIPRASRKTGVPKHLIARHRRAITPMRSEQCRRPRGHRFPYSPEVRSRFYFMASELCRISKVDARTAIETIAGKTSLCAPFMLWLLEQKTGWPSSLPPPQWYRDLESRLPAR